MRASMDSQFIEITERLYQKGYELYYIDENEPVQKYNTNSFLFATHIKTEHKIKLLNCLNEHYSSLDKVKRLVGYDVDCFLALLGNIKLKNLHLVPFEKKAGQPLIDFSSKAIEAGCTVEDIADATFSRSESWSGKESDMLLNKITNYKDSIKLTQNDEIIKVIKKIVDYYERRRERALKSEHDEDVYGRY